jgi:tRNA modification GTPase
MALPAGTIVALATPPGPARRAILRLSGPRAGELARAVLRDEVPRFEPGAARALCAGRFDDGGGTQPVELYWWREPRSYTREDLAEFHLRGAAALARAAEQRLLALGAAPARPGEFTRRAFLNGRIDLSQAEGVLALTQAANEAERAAAAQLLEGGLERRASAARERLLELATLCEASLDFDERETGHVAREELARRLAAARAALDEATRFELARAAPSGLPRVVLVGAPNAGKSTLWNALTGGRALTSTLAGTTRDALEGLWPLAGGTCLLVDGPGLEAAAAGPSARAQELFARTRRAADLVLGLVGPGQDPAALPGEVALLVFTQSDRTGARTVPTHGRVAVSVSAHTGEGFAELARAVDGLLFATPAAGAEGGLARLLFARHGAALRRAAVALDEVEQGFQAGLPLDLLSEGVRAALEALEDLAGRTTPEDVLERLFASFCLGK